MNIGDKIPEILGIDQDGREIKASDYKGRKIVLYSYPKANTSGCTAEACSLQAHKEELAAAGYEIIGVSKDKQTLQKKFADAQGLQFPLIADTETTLLQQLGCWGEKVACGRKTIGILRTTYLVDENGIIQKIFTPKEIKTKIHAEQILRVKRKMNEILSNNTGKPLEQLEKDVERDHFMTAEEALSYGLIDEIIAPRR